MCITLWATELRIKSQKQARLKVSQVHLAIFASNIPSIINQNMSITQVCVVRSFFLEPSKRQPDIWFPAHQQSEYSTLPGTLKTYPAVILPCKRTVILHNWPIQRLCNIYAVPLLYAYIRKIFRKAKQLRPSRCRLLNKTLLTIIIENTITINPSLDWY